MGLSPMMRQYMDIKEQYPDCILMFRLGDFYELFFEDAKTGARELELTLTGKNCGLEERAPMCGVPFHSVDTYVAQLVEKGYKVAICEQVEDSENAKGIVKREIVQIVTPGTITSNEILNENENNYLASVYYTEESIGFAYCDVSTGEIYAAKFDDIKKEKSLADEIVKINAREVLINDIGSELLDTDEITNLTGTAFNCPDESYYDYRVGRDSILRQFGVEGLMGIGIEEASPVVQALGAMLQYIFETQKQILGHITHLNVYDAGSHMSLDKSTIRNLEITETLFSGQTKGSLLWVLDKTNTAMGSRKLKKWLKEPLNSHCDIVKRLDAVEYLLKNTLARNDLREHLKGVYDFERLTGRIACGRANGKDLTALRNSCAVLPDIKSEISGSGVELLEELDEGISSLREVYDIINNAITEDPPFTIKEGGIIKEGFSDELDSLKDSIKDAQNWITNLESIEKERTGIKNLKVGYNKVFGYYLEITKSNYDNIPDNYIRKQTLVNAERFITPELKEQESVVFNAETKINQLEYELFSKVREYIREFISEIQRTSKAVSTLDVLTSFSEVSAANDYCRPAIRIDSVIKLEKGRHPVIEQTIKDGIFVSNDTYMDREDSSLLLITGPNMAGKSTYMRQTALIVLMAQIGCFVPCERAEIGLSDRIFTRIGASDNLAQGQSTFFVEMSELAYILNSATEKSLIILDEIGRGTSTYDGLSIAWAVAEYLCEKVGRVRTMFATHYHELTVLEGTVKGIRNLNIAVSEENGRVIFLHKILEGSASQSYGIEVAKLAGVPQVLLEAADFKLKELESKKIDNEAIKPAEEEQLSLFSFSCNPVVEKLKTLDLMHLTPSEAFKILEELKAAAEDN